ncbi:MAG TPA: aminoglycoside phosphotransferase family protein [Candidatus Saccharimonadales bacterium]|nr:aminoglycoside phosphotransferase family protein [Candidatus Saccharimonadales bacterium]
MRNSAIPYQMLEMACRQFNLGQLYNTQVVHGGLAHRVYKCTTESGDVAIKEMVARTDEAGFEERIERSSTIEQAARMTGIEIPEVILLPGTNKVLATVTLESGKTCLVRAHHWLSGYQPMTETDLADPIWLAETLVRLHSMSVTLPAAYFPVSYIAPPWEMWQQKASLHKVSWFPQFTSTLPIIKQFERLIQKQQVLPIRRVPVPSHRDLTAKNILCRGTNYVLSDWDSADWVVDALQDVFTVAIDWSFARQGKLSEQRICTIVNAYQRRTGYEPPAGSSYQDYCSDWATGVLLWLAYNLARSFNNDVKQQSAASAEAHNILALITEVGSWTFGRAQSLEIGARGAAF